MFADAVSQSTILDKLADSLHMSTSDLLTWLQNIDGHVLAKAFNTDDRDLKHKLVRFIEWWKRHHSSDMFEILSKAWKLHNERIEEVRQRESKYIGAIRSFRGTFYGGSFHHLVDTICEDSGEATNTCLSISPGEKLLHRGWELQCLEAMSYSRSKRLVWSLEARRNTGPFASWQDLALDLVGPWRAKKIKFVDR